MLKKLILILTIFFSISSSRREELNEQVVLNTMNFYFYTRENARDFNNILIDLNLPLIFLRVNRDGQGDELYSYHLLRDLTEREKSLIERVLNSFIV